MTASTPVEDATIIARDGRIVSVVAGGAAPAGAKVIDAAGRPVTPGLFKAATQIGLTEVTRGARNQRSSGRQRVRSAPPSTSNIAST